MAHSTSQIYQSLSRGKGIFAYLDSLAQSETDSQIRARIQPIDAPPVPQFNGQEYSAPCDLCVLKDDGRIVMAHRAAQVRFADGQWFWMEGETNEPSPVTDVAGQAPTHWLAIPVPPADDRRSSWRQIIDRMLANAS